MHKTKVYYAVIQSTCFSIAMDISDYLGYLKVLRWESALQKRKSPYPAQKAKGTLCSRRGELLSFPGYVYKF